MATPSPAEVAHEAAALLVQEAFPAIRCLHPALPRRPPVLPEEWHGTAEGCDGWARRTDGRGPAWRPRGRACPGRLLGGTWGPVRERLRDPGVRSEVPALAERTVEGRGAREARCSAALRSGPPYLSWAAGRGSLLPEEPPALSPAPPARRPRGFVYRLDLFSAAPAAPALLAVAQPLADGNLKPRCGAEAPTALSAPGPSAPPSRTQRAQLLRLEREAGRSGKLHPVLLQLPAWRGAGRTRPGRRLDRCGFGVGGKEAPRLPAPSCDSRAPRFQAALRELTRHCAARSRVAGCSLLASLTA